MRTCIARYLQLQGQDSFWARWDGPAPALWCHQDPRSLSAMAPPEGRSSGAVRDTDLSAASKRGGQGHAHLHVELVPPSQESSSKAHHNLEKVYATMKSRCCRKRVEEGGRMLGRQPKESTVTHTQRGTADQHSVYTWTGGHYQQCLLQPSVE